MENLRWFNDIPVIGALSPDELTAKLCEIDEKETLGHIENNEHPAPELDGFGSINFGINRKLRAWQHTSHTFGYIKPFSSKIERSIKIEHAGTIPSNIELKNKRIKITLDRLRIADYPGTGSHFILFDFYGQNQTSNILEHVHYNTVFKVREGEELAIIGFPIFVGLNVGSEGVVFKCFTVNVKNSKDESFLKFLESDVFKSGVKLFTVAQPAISLFSEVVFNLTKAIAKRNRNIPVQNFYLGLDFSNITTRACLNEGSYIVLQAPDSEWNWNDWHYDPFSGKILNSIDPDKQNPFNYIVFSVSKYNEE